PIKKTTTREKGFWLKEIITETLNTGKILALVSTTEYLAEVPTQILEKAVSFRTELRQVFPKIASGYPGIQTFVLTVASENSIKNIVRETPNDPLLLYRPYENDNHLHLQGNFVVLGWWGADLEEI
ncbi:unnamed protein product, partial [marine sediment metagenome]